MTRRKQMRLRVRRNAERRVPPWQWLDVLERECARVQKLYDDELDREADVPLLSAAMNEEYT